MALNLLTVKELEEIVEIVKQEENQEEAKQRFKIETTEQLSWALRKKAAIQKKRDELKEIAEAEIQRIKDWLEEELKKWDQSDEFFDNLIRDYALRRRAEDPKFKVKTPYGSVGFRKQQLKWNYDETKLLQELKRIGRNDLIRVKEELDKVSIKRAFKVEGEHVVNPETGEVLEGVTVEQPEDKLDIKLA